MIEFIERCFHPIIGNNYWVKCVLVRDIWRPVFANCHSDNIKHALDKEHYHQDWRFVEEQYILAQKEVFNTPIYDLYLPISNREYFAPIIKEYVEEEKYIMREYLRHFNIFEARFGSLEYDMRSAKMRSFTCPHHKTNLRSCQIINNVVQCPQHGLKWNVKTGDLVT